MTKKNYCYTSVPEIENGYFNNRWRLAKVIENEPGYYPYGKNHPNRLDSYVGTSDYIDSLVKTFNKRLKISDERALTIVASTY